MRITRIGAIDIGAPARHSAGSYEIEASGSRALVAIEPAAPHASPRALTRHPAAPFLAQLIATHQHAPQTRMYRRVTLEEAIAAYREMNGTER